VPQGIEPEELEAYFPLVGHAHHDEHHDHRDHGGIGLKLVVALVLCAGLVGGVIGGWITRGVTNSPGAAILPNGASIPALVARVLPSVVSIDVKGSGTEDLGTGMIITSGGYVVTNNHVIAAAAAGGSISVTRSGSTTALPATLVGTIPGDDVALLHITGAHGLPTVRFANSAKLVVGDAAVAIGNALGLQASTPTVTSGIISALGRTVTAGDSTSATETLTDMIQTDAAINPGNSGGPLLDSAGDVVGMNTAVAATTSDGTSAQNIGFAIPAARIESSLPQLEAGGSSIPTSTSGFLGVEVTTLTSQLRSEYHITPTKGVVVIAIGQGTPAASSPLASGDVITKFDGAQIVTSAQFAHLVHAKHPGVRVILTYWSGSQAKQTTITLGKNPNA
jgi:S1-C subfamily serine protease